MKFQKKIDLPVVIVFTVFFIIGIIICSDYGISWDEPYHRINGFVSLNFLRKIFSLDIYPNLTHDSNFLEESSKMYGVIFDLPMAFIEKKLLLTDSKHYFLLRHYFNFFIFFISSVFFYLILKKRFSKRLSLIGLLFIILTPRIFAESFYNMKDLVFLSFFIISLYFVITVLNNPSYKNIFWSSLTCALAIDARIIGIISPFLVITFFVLYFMDKKKLFKKNILKIITFVFLLTIFTVIFWPYLWNDPLGNFIHVLKDMSRHIWTGSVFYFGNHISALNLPWHYPIVWIFITTPIFYLFLFILGSFLILKRLSVRFLLLSPRKGFNELWRGNKERMDIIFFLIFYFTLFLIIELNSVLYGGWRHLYFIYPCLIFISIRGLEYISRKLSLRNLIIIVTPFLIYIGGWMLKNHPYQSLYFNILSGDNVVNNFDVDYWGISNRSSLEYIAKNDTRDKIMIYVASDSPYHFSLLFLDKDKRKKFEFVENPENSDFIVTNHYYQKDNPVTINKKLKVKFKLLKEFKVDDIIINSIYKTK